MIMNIIYDGKYIAHNHVNSLHGNMQNVDIFMFGISPTIPLMTSVK